MNAQQKAMKHKLTNIRTQLMAAEAAVDCGDHEAARRWVGEIHVLSQPERRRAPECGEALRRAIQLGRTIQ